MKKFIVLMYHGFDSFEHPSEMKEKGDYVYIVDEDIFSAQLKYIINKKIPVTTLKESSQILRHNNTSISHSIILTFDDGHITNYLKAFPLLIENGFKGYFFITTDWIGSEYYMNRDMLRELDSFGMVIGSHGVTHKFWNDLSNEEVYNELYDSKKRIEDIIQKEVDCLSPPGGRINNNIIIIAKNIGYKHIFSSEQIINHFPSKKNVYGRFAIMRNQSAKYFIKIANGTPPYSLYIKNQMLYFAKKILGNNLYQQIRSYVIKVV